MSKSRFLYQNFITSESMLSVSSAKTGIVTTALKSGTGSAVLTTSGAYSGTTDLEYVLEIDHLNTGEVDSSTFRWSDDGGATWDVSDRITRHASATVLNNAVLVNWASGTGADFVLADTWYFKGIQPFSAGKMIDYDRDHRYRSAALNKPNTITIDLGSSKQIKAVVIYDHNFTSAATIKFKASTARSTFTTYSSTITWADDKITHYPTATTTRYCQLQVGDNTNTDAYIEIGELYVGSYLELSRNYSEGFNKDTQFLLDSKTTQYGVQRSRFYNTQLTFGFDFNAMSSTDITNMNTMIASITSRSTGVIKPIYFNADAAVTGDTWLVKMNSFPVKHNTRTYYDMPIEFIEVLKSL